MKRILLMGGLVVLLGAIYIQSVSAAWEGCPWAYTGETSMRVCQKGDDAVVYAVNRTDLGPNLTKKTLSTCLTSNTLHQAHTQCIDPVFGIVDDLWGPQKYCTTVGASENNSITPACGPRWNFRRGRAHIETSY